MEYRNSAKILFNVLIIIIFALWSIAIFLVFFVPYHIENWQVDCNNHKYQLSMELIRKMEKFNPEIIINIKRYENELIKKAVKKGMSKYEVKHLMDLADKQGPKVKFPIFIMTSLRKNIPVFVVFYKYSLIPNKRDYDEVFDVVIQRGIDKVIESQGTP